MRPSRQMRMKRCGEPERDDANRVILNLCVKNDDSFLSPFAVSDTPMISPEVANYIENRTCLSQQDEQYVLHIKSDCIDEEEQALYRAGIQEYYTQQYRFNERELRRNRRLAWAMVAVGLLVLALAVFLEFRFSSLVWAEFVDIIAWVLLWEGIYIELFDNRDRRLKRHAYLSYLSMEIQFYPL